MAVAQLDNKSADPGMNFRLYARQKPVVLALLAALGVIFFLAVTGLSRAYHAQRDLLGERWFNRGLADLNSGHFDNANTDFRSALLYARDNYDYQLSLAQALIGLKRTGEAYSYLVNLWDRQPENGVVNLELARIAAQRNETDQAQRYYHNAIYATWPSDQEGRRRDTRLELVEYLLSIDAKKQAQSELIALEENLGDDPAQQQRVGELFLRAQDYDHALAAFRLSLKRNHRNAPALAGAGWAAFQSGRYSLAEHYLQAALAINPADTQTAEQLKTTELVLQMDPFRRSISPAERNRIVVKDFAIAGHRLSSCATPNPPSLSPASQPSLTDRWANMKSQVNEQGLRRNPGLIEEAMDVVFEIERQVSATCGPPTAEDLALLLIAKLHEGT
jgi:tetratricopeptide (TPR) repeat protein